MSRNLNTLAEYGLLDFEQDGRSKRPIVRYDAIDVEIALGDGQRHSTDGETPARM